MVVMDSQYQKRGADASINSGTTPTLSIVIPVLNEERAVRECLSQLALLNNSSAVECIFVDGGSHDNTQSILSEAKATWVTSEAGRAKQMNAGAHLASAPIIMFLHVDTVLPQNAVQQIQEQYVSDKSWGRFNVAITGDHCMFSVIAWFINQRSRLTKVATGDQAIWISRDLFQRINGFSDIPLMEDVEICKRLRMIAPMAVHKSKVITSGRRWIKFGIWKTIWLMWSLRWSFWRGECPVKLAARYR